jgi:NAD(P)-dependent dehydrogenase (short-subunit alcohol dehydrogenase family)
VKEGACVVIGDTLEAEGRATAERLARQGEILFVPADVRDKASVEHLVAATLERFGRIDIPVQNAGIYPYTLLPDIPVEEWDAVLGVNLRGCFLAIQACIAPMRAQGYGRIVLTSSITEPRVTSPGHGHYSASKAGINGLIRAAAIELAPFGITVNGVEPGNILTEGMEAERSPEFIRDNYIPSMKGIWPELNPTTPRVVPVVNRWYAFEMMAKANTPGSSNGLIRIWHEGNLIYEENNVRLRDVAELGINKVAFTHSIHHNVAATNYAYWMILSYLLSTSDR